MTAENGYAIGENGQEDVDGLVRLLDLERIEEDIYRGNSPKVNMQRVFGGQVAGQALVAAGRTVAPERPVHSLHSYFIRPGDPSVPIVYTVERTRDGRSFSTRRVTAIQHGKAIFTLSASFQTVEGGMDHQPEAPDAPDPEGLPDLEELYAGHDTGTAISRLRMPLAIRYVDAPGWERHGNPRGPDLNRLWMRTSGRLPDDPLLHVCALTFASDLTLLDNVLMRHGLAWGLDPVVGASLDHAMWFHRPFRADEWQLYVAQSPTAGGGRGLATGRFYTREGDLSVRVVQEGLLPAATASATAACTAGWGGPRARPPPPVGAPGGIRTHTERVLNPCSLPVGVQGQSA